MLTAIDAIGILWSNLLFLSCLRNYDTIDKDVTQEQISHDTERQLTLVNTRVGWRFFCGIKFGNHIAKSYKKI